MSRVDRSLFVFSELGAAVGKIHGVGEIERELVPDVASLR
jgi:hypothetical protein